MSIPRILVIDDQYATDKRSQEQLLTPTNCALVEATASDDDPAVADAFANKKTAAISICRGQTVENDWVWNSVEEACKAVAFGWNASRRWSLVLLDVQFDSGKIEGTVPKGQQGDQNFGERIRDELLTKFPDIPLMMLTAKMEKEFDGQGIPYFPKCELRERILISKLLEHGCLTFEQIRRILKLSEGEVVVSKEMREVFQKAFVYAESDESVLLLGETGVGKEVVANFIHRVSKRSSMEWIARNVSEFSPSLIESELFGHERNAFNNAQLKKGVFELADKGTLFLDEIGDLPRELQSKLLRAIQEKVIFRVGGVSKIPADVKLITATCEAQKLRDDLNYRIDTYKITIPPLRDRSEDIVPLSKMFVEKSAQKAGRSGITLSGDAERVLQEYRFPGNVRELKGVIERIIRAKLSNSIVSAEDVRSSISAVSEKSVVDSVKTTKSTRESDAPVESRVGRSGADALTLANVAERLAEIPIDLHDPSLWGSKPRLESAVRGLLMRIAGAALEATKKVPTGDPEVTAAIQNIYGNEQLDKTKCAREIKKLLGQTQEKTKVPKDLKELLISEWRSGPR